MKTKILIITILIFFNSCDKHNGQKQPALKDYKNLKNNTYKEDVIRDIINIDATILELLPKNIEWTNQNDVFVFFRHEKVYFNFSVSCTYWFPSKITDNEIVFYWEINEDCTYDVGIKRHFSEIKNPEIGKPFGKIKVLNDTTLFIDYYYTDWVKKINSERNNNDDTLFPTYLKKIDLNYLSYLNIENGNK